MKKFFSNLNTSYIKDNFKIYADIVNTELENNIINTINDTVSNNLKSMNEKILVAKQLYYII